MHLRRELTMKIGAVVLLLALGYGATFAPMLDWIGQVSAWMHNNPVAGPSVFIILAVLATVLFVPGSVVMMVGGYLFGLALGLTLVAIAIPLAAQAAFGVGRWLGAPSLRARITAAPKLLAIETALRKEAFLIVLLTRLSLVVPFNVLNYIYGATSVPARTHFIATAAGMMPAVALYVYLGTLARDIGQIISGTATPSELTYWVAAAGLVIVSATVWLVHRTAANALQKHLADANKTQQEAVVSK